MRRVYFVHALKNTMLPVITVGGVQIGTMVAYTILTETVFQWPGMGLMFLDAIHRADIPLIVTYLMIVGVIFVVTNTIVDLIYGFVNPTVKLTGKPHDNVHTFDCPKPLGALARLLCMVQLQT